MNHTIAALGAILMSMSPVPHVLGHYTVELIDRWRAARHRGRHRKPRA